VRVKLPGYGGVNEKIEEGDEADDDVYIIHV
jgi:hypothetical protein